MLQKLLLFSFWVLLVLPSIAQKPIIKSVLHQQQTRNTADELAISTQINQEFNTFNKIALQEYSYADKKGNLQLEKQVRYSYDPQGRHQNTLEYDGQGILNAETKMYWDEYDNKNKVEDISYSDGKKVAVAVTYQLEYDDNGNRKTERYFSNEGNEIKGKNWYYNRQKEVKKTVAWVDDKKSARSETHTTYKRDKNGNLVRSVSKEKVNGKIFRKDIRFFSNNYVIEWKKYLNGKLESIFRNEYRDSVIIRTTRQNKRKVISIEEDEKQQSKIEKNTNRRSKRNRKEDIWVTNTEYDAYGNILVTSQSMNGSVFFVTQYTYDDYGNQIKMIEYNKEKDIKKEEQLEYNEWGNVSKRTKFLDDKVISIDTYEYEYFE